MEKIDIGHHISQKYDEELEAVRNQVLSMGGMVEQQLADAMRALISGDSELAAAVVKNDYKVNALEVSIDERCAQILARRQPAARDLRLLVAIIKTITDLERIGDEAGKIGRMAVHIAEMDRPVKRYVDIDHLGDHVRKMMHDTLDAYARTDVDAAIQVAQEDIKVDHEYEALLRQMITFMMEDPRSITQFLDVVWAARALERIGDHARNICEYIIYFVKGKDVRHTSLEQIEQELRVQRPR